MTLIKMLCAMFFIFSLSVFGNNTPIDDIKLIIQNDFAKKIKERINKKESCFTKENKEN